MNNSFESFYEENKEFLSKNYPGLKLLRLIREFDECKELTEEEFKAKVLSGVPLEYISNVSYFYKDSFFVDDRVLIPRSETEILVEECINYIKKNNVQNIYEIGVGSGCISISIALECPGICIKASDISTDALAVANKNLEGRDLDISFENVDLIDGGEYELIVSNPPYIKELADKDGVHNQTDSHEPHLALYLKDSEYTLWFKKLFDRCAQRLKHGGAFYMEGHEDHLGDLKDIALNYFSSVKIKKDYTHRDRFLLCYKD